MITIPGKVDTDNRRITVRQAQRRYGLFPMAVGSQHAVTVTVDGKPQTIHCIARNHEDVPRGAKARLFCQHPKCAGKTWESYEAMRAAHGQTVAMVKAEEAHVYGLWSDDPQAEGPRKAAEERVKTAEGMMKEAEASMKSAKTLGERELARDDKAQAFTELMEARKHLGEVSGSIGLIAPPEMA